MATMHGVALTGKERHLLLELVDRLLEEEKDVKDALIDSDMMPDTVDEFLEAVGDQHERINDLQVLRRKLVREE